MRIHNFLKSNKDRFPLKDVFVFNDIRITHLKLYEEVRSISYGLEKLGLKKDNKVSIILNNSLEFIYTVLAIANIGAVAVPLNISLSDRDLLNQIILTKSNFLITWEEKVKQLLKKKNKLKITNRKIILINGKGNKFSKFNDLYMKIPPLKYKLGINKFSSDCDFIFGLTSGSTSDPKIMKFSQKTKILRSLHAKKLYKLDESENIILSTPMYHSISLRLIFLPIIIGSKCIIMEKFTNKNWFSLVEKNKVTFSILVSPQIASISTLLDKRSIKKISSIKSIVSCCSPLDSLTKKKISYKLQCKFFDTYGASEVGTITNLKINQDDNKNNTLGKVVPDTKLLFKDQNGKIGKSIRGQILCKSKNIFSGYFNNNKDNKINFYKDYFITGDVGYLSNNGHLILSGREKDIIITGGVNVFANDVEKVLNLHNQIKESSIIGVKHKVLGEVICAFVITKKNQPFEEEKIKRYCSKLLADYQMPFYYKVVKKFPRGSLNKISKYKLKLDYKNLNNI